MEPSKPLFHTEPKHPALKHKPSKFFKRKKCEHGDKHEVCCLSDRKQHTLVVTVSHRPQMGPSSCGKTSSGLPPILHYGELYNYFLMYYNVIIVEIKCTMNVICLNHPETTPPGPPSSPSVYGKIVFHETSP